MRLSKPTKHKSRQKAEDSHSWLLNVSEAYRLHARRHFAVQQVASWTTVLALLVSHAAEPILTNAKVGWWALAFAGSWGVRMALFARLFSFSPSAVAQSGLLKCIPLFSAIVSIVFWMYTIPLFFSTEHMAYELILCAGLLAISISIMGMWPVTPATALFFNIALWLSFSYNLWAHTTASLTAILALNLSILVVLWVNVFVAVHQVQAYARKTAELDAALEEERRIKDEMEALKNQALSALSASSINFQHSTHDVRQRLHSVKLWVSSSMECVRNDPGARRALGKVADQVDDLEGYFTKVLDFTRLSASNILIELEQNNLQAIFHTLELTFEQAAMERGIDFRVRPTPWILWTDRSLLLRVLENLVANAIHHSRKGVLVAARCHGDFIAIEVWDQGPGIKASSQQKIFDAYYQEPQPGGQLGKGAGLGLAIVRSLISTLRYEVTMTSTLGRGTMFRILIPKAAKVLGKDSR
ncbi:sensor histidine kinase [Variovorax saccharolyticus]|uniref:sensor histidine kinase n=1 Tax=Variovorax saccharolyticus TaxID=3053516 RepID=UPI0025761F16|nr:HAMP domain-containing sensor histidine kinase [Variovorax sp. J31P216]MDM0030345.1 HAMP domain-containing sensor histidine kinase [Variovorax sp. J31P216]